MIGVPLDVDAVRRGVDAAAAAMLGAGGGEDFAAAICTTDRWPKRCTVRLDGVTVSAQAKGAGMMEPGFATLLCFVQTDAELADPERALREATAGSFERITVDGQMSTNDMVMLQGTGAAAKPLPEGLLEAVMLQLALEVVADGEGATRVGRVEVREAGSDAEAERVARAIANSPLVKTALFGRDPNWGRIAQAAGMALAGEQLAELGPAEIDAEELASEEPEADSGVRLGRGDASAPTSTSATSPTTTSSSTPSTRHESGQNPNVALLLEALPYIREFHGRTVVIKYGGAAMRDPELREAFATDVVLLKYVGLNPVIVHGGGPEITSYMERLGMEVRFHEGLRVSDAETVEVAKMVLLGKLNSDIVLRLNRHGQPAVGLSGEDGWLFEVGPVANAAEVGFVGSIERVDVDVLNHIAADYIPVIASAGADRDGNSYNINADEAAGKVAAALGAYKAIFLTDVEGWLDDPGRSLDPDLGGDRGRDIAAARVGAGRDAAEARRLPRRDRGRDRARPHHRWPQAAFAAARAVHRRGDRDEGDSMRAALQTARCPRSLLTQSSGSWQLLRFNSGP